jgi:hypothetical protein
MNDGPEVPLLAFILYDVARSLGTRNSSEIGVLTGKDLRSVVQRFNFYSSYYIRFPILHGGQSP